MELGKRGEFEKNPPDLSINQRDFDKSASYVLADFSLDSVLGRTFSL